MPIFNEYIAIYKSLAYLAWFLFSQKCPDFFSFYGYKVASLR